MIGQIGKTHVVEGNKVDISIIRCRMGSVMDSSDRQQGSIRRPGSIVYPFQFASDASLWEGACIDHIKVERITEVGLVLKIKREDAAAGGRPAEMEPVVCFQ